MGKYSVSSPDSLYSLADAAVKTFMMCMVALLCTYSALWMAQDVFPEWKLSAAAGAWLKGLVILTAAVYEIGIRAMKRGRFGCRILIPVIYSVLFWRWAKKNQIDLEDGACALGTEFLEKFNRHLKMSVSIWRGKKELTGMSLAFWLTAAVLVLLILALLTGRRVWLLLLPAAVLAAELLIGYTPKGNGVVMFFTGLLFVHTGGENGRRNRLCVHVDRRQEKIPWYVYWVPSVCLAGGAVLMLFFGSILFDAAGMQMLEKSARIVEFQRNTERYVSDVFSSYFIQQREVIDNHAPDYTGKEMLRVTASCKPAQDVLLKGFCGTDYQNGSWVSEKQAFADACSRVQCGEETAAGELLKNPYDVYTEVVERFESYDWFRDFGYIFSISNEQIDYTVEHTGVRSRYAYIPYAVDDYTGKQEDGRLIADLTVQKARGRKKFTFHGWNQPVAHAALNGMTGDSSKPVFRWYDEFAGNNYLKTSDQVPGLQECAAAVSQYAGQENNKASASGIQSVYTADIYADSYAYSYGEYDSSDDDIPSFHKLDIPKILREYQQAAQGYGDVLSRDFMRISEAALICSYLQQYQTYSTDLDPISSEEDPVRYFLMQSHKGYCVHFASAAVLFLREYGIPARYAAGYVARVNDFKPGKGGTYVASVKDSSAHAWVEIYLDQLGWVPLDVTPGDRIPEGTEENKDGGTLDQQDTQTETDKEKSQEDEDTRTDKNTQTEQEEEDAGKDGGKSADRQIQKVSGILAALIFVLLLFCMPAGIVCLVIRMYHMEAARELREGKYRRAVSRMNRRIYRRLCLRGKVRHRNLTDTEYKRLLMYACPQVPVRDWERFVQVARKAAFAGEELTEEEAFFCYRVYQMLNRKLYQSIIMAKIK